MLLARARRQLVLGLGLLVMMTWALVSVVATPRADAAVDLSRFKPGNIISDAMFFNPHTMSAADIQRFLNIKGSACTGSMCLKNYRAAVASKPADKYCRGYTSAGSETAATIIDKAAKSCGINPQVLIVILQKEQGLVTRNNPTDVQYRKAMGFACPDTAACNPAYTGFGDQVYFAAKRFQEYASPDRYTWIKVGQHNQIRYHPNTACGSSSVFIENKATAGLYYYTPYQPNKASLAAGAGTGDACSSYGNRNFYRYYMEWFGDPTNPRFTDVPSWHAFVSEMTWLADRKITTGYADGSFRPAQPVLREQMAAFLYRYSFAGANPGTSQPVSTFHDVAPSHAFTRHISWLAGTGITTGYTDGTYRPAQPVLREQMAAFLYRLAGSPAVTLPAKSPFRDVAPSHPFYRQMVWLSQTGVTTGYSDGTFRPGQPVLREQMAAFLNRFDNKGLLRR